MQQAIRRILPGLGIVAVAFAVIGAVAAAARSTLPAAFPKAEPPGRGVRELASRLDGILAARAAAASIEPAAAADDLAVLRRTWLAVAGTIPSLEEIRRFEADPRPDRLDRWLAAILANRRSAEHLAGVLADAFAGSDGGPPFVYRRDRFTSWLADALHAGRPFTDIVSEMVAGDGLWTSEPAVNFVTQAASGGRVDENALAGRVARSFLGVRLDCAQCHDHPFAPWTQGQFEGLAACFAAVRLSPLGVRDSGPAVLRIEPAMAAAGMMPETDAEAAEKKTGLAARRVPPQVPFDEASFTGSGSPRKRLAAWITHGGNRRFERAVANRCWAIAFGRPWHEPVDDLPDPGPAPSDDDPLDLLGSGFRAGNGDLRETLAAICSTAAFRRSSTHPDLDDSTRAAAVTQAWAAFPLTQLPPGTMIAAMIQAGSVRTIDPDSHLLVRTVQFLRSVDFTREYGGGDPNEPATIPQALVRMNGRLARELCEANAFSGPGRVAGLTTSDAARLDALFLACFTRRPDATERESLLPVLAAGEPARGVEDLYWSLFNSAEFCWNH